MKRFFLNLLGWAHRTIGSWITRLVAWIISTGYFVFKPERVRNSLDLYRALFPGKGRLFHYYCVWKQFHEYAANYSDTIQSGWGGPLAYDSEGWEYLEEAAASGRGCMILISHLGNWEIGARGLKQKGLDMTMIMGHRPGSATSDQQKEYLRSDGLGVKVSELGTQTPLGGVEILSALRQGRMVSMAGDTSWTDRHHQVPVRFLGHEVLLPAAPHALALVAGVPILTMFGFRLGRNRHHFVAHPPRYVTASSRTDRQRAIQASAQVYADQLAESLRQYPWQWGIFTPFLGKRL